MSTVLLHNMGGLLSLCSMLLVSLFNRSESGLDNLGLISVDLICNKDIYMTAVVS